MGRGAAGAGRRKVPGAAAAAGPTLGSRSTTPALLSDGLPAMAWQHASTFAGRGAHKYSVTGVSMSADGRLLCTCAQDGSATLWDVFTATLIRELSTGTQCVVVSADGSIVCSGSTDATASVWNSCGDCVRLLEGAHEGCIRSIAVSEETENRTIVTGSEDSTIGVWDGNTGTLLRKLEGVHNSWVRHRPAALHAQTSATVAASALWCVPVVRK